MSCIMMKWNNELMNNELMNGKIIFTKENPLYVSEQISEPKYQSVHLYW